MDFFTKRNIGLSKSVRCSPQVAPTNQIQVCMLQFVMISFPLLLNRLSELSYNYDVRLRTLEARLNLASENGIESHYADYLDHHGHFPDLLDNFMNRDKYSNPRVSATTTPTAQQNDSLRQQQASAPGTTQSSTHIRVAGGVMPMNTTTVFAGPPPSAGFVAIPNELSSENEYATVLARVKISIPF